MDPAREGPEGSREATEALPRKRSTLLRIGGSVFILDQATKLLVLHTLAPGQRIPVLGDVLAFHHVTNYGTALGFQSGRPALAAFLAVVSVGLLSLLFYFLPKARSGRIRATALAMGGAFGNLFDRLRGTGVVDFLELHVGMSVLPVFNLADVAVLGGACWLAGSIWWDERAQA